MVSEESEQFDTIGLELRAACQWPRALDHGFVRMPDEPTTRKRLRSALSIIKAAKEAGCHSVKFSDGTVVVIGRDEDAEKAVGNPWDAELQAAE